MEMALASSLQTLETQLPRARSKVLEELCWISLEDVESGISTAEHRKAVWLDDRGSGLDLEGSGDARQYENPLTVATLYRALKRPRFNQEDLPDAAR